MIDFTVNKDIQKHNAEYCKSKGIKLPTYAMMKNPELVPDEAKEKLKKTGLWDIDPVNLYRITWKNEAKASGGLFGKVNHLVLPEALTGTKAKIVVITGKWFPTGAHKVGATYGCLAPVLTTGQFNPFTTKAVWPSTGNYCRGGAYISSLLACEAIAILPEEMSQERFNWLKKVAGEVIATPGSESNVKEIFDKCWELKASGQDLRIFNQFDEMGNPLWHYNVTGSAIEEALGYYMKDGDKMAGFVSSSGSGGTLAAGSYLKTKFPHMKIVAAEALQCPTLLNNGYGAHRIEGIGDKHVPWVHNCKDTDFVSAIDDEDSMRLLRLFNEKTGRDVLKANGVDAALVDQLDLFGISGVANVLAAIKFAKYNELTEKDYVVTIATDSMELYGSRIDELAEARGAYNNAQAERDMELILGQSIDNLKELSYYDRKSIHNLKYFTWIEQQGRELEELNAQWYDHDNYWYGTMNQADQIDEHIKEFNEMIDKS
ncbi:MULTISPECIES: pyridoxal-phosphate dependent enzyme [unclassified Oceanispirochaeta]|uniref:pyridoxal-phosphate dependent enzyme n=1 Tax=unclassified Oceanispirochaeta TaxID=2635722 RepID=UPI000E099B17|nr:MULTISPECIES: pyridoxal-phosphate dependent enzyme [unclassified Oceanispirochaeta]MBF9015749.1 pyridoxal-phosphate dependent enzyme [Oceanispirochaeta sp. M2]NPD72212.1 pyridoxal-phosphate dependent enzyme [Oceanispirochaeta sp. M1]RDG32310.1 pyridoxal-phosphate dependent enzyme [Oceanispirochaeta sp. M1]